MCAYVDLKQKQALIIRISIYFLYCVELCIE